ncbi:MAG: thioredoxin, partial [Chloroflexota bacterium]
ENIATVTDGNFKSEVLEADQPVLVDFWAEWCGPCRMVAPVVEQLAQENAGHFKVVKVDVDKNPETPRQYGIMGIPTLILFKDGKAAERIVGYMPKAQLWKRLEPHVKAEV